jgi:hypothetical protein
VDWQALQGLAVAQTELKTSTGVPFRLVNATERSVTVQVSSGRRHTIGRTNLERAASLVRDGETLRGPGDYRQKVADERPAYAWAILYELGYLT